MRRFVLNFGIFDRARFGDLVVAFFDFVVGRVRQIAVAGYFVPVVAEKIGESVEFGFSLLAPLGIIGERRGAVGAKFDSGAF